MTVYLSALAKESTAFIIITQAISIVATVIALSSYQFKTQRSIALMQLFSTCLFTVHYFMLSAYSGAILNAIGAVRSAIFSQRNKKAWAAHPAWIAVFIILAIGSYLLNIFVLIPDIQLKDYFIEALPTIGIVITTFGLHMKEAKHVRLFTLINSPCWLAYNFINGSIGGVVTEIAGSLSIIIGMLRLDIKRKK